MKNPIARNTFHTSVVLGLRLLVQAGILLLVTRLLGPNDYGPFAGITALAVMLGTLSTLGTHIVLLATISQNPAKRSDILPFAVTTTLLCGSILFAVYTLISPIVLGRYNLDIGARCAIGIAELLILPLLTIPSAEHQGHGRIPLSQALLSLPLVLRLAVVLGVLLLHAHSPVTTYAYGYLATAILALTIATFSLHDAWPPISRWRMPTTSELKHSAGYAVLNITAAGPTELDKTLAPRLLLPVTASVYSAAARVVGSLTVPVIAMMLSVMPRLFRDSQVSGRQTQRFLLQVLAAALGYGLLLGAALWLTAPVFTWLFGSNFAGMQRAVRWLCVAAPGMSLRIALGTTLMSLQHPWLRATFELAGLAILFIAATMLAPRYGLAGMALTLACSEWGMAIFGSIILAKVRQHPIASP
ncbi:MAG TPA: lipopolysaccharide biosynthesis protein [Dyella sp.]|uniref:lipopolysaccharide biosynthesis protein n=1 Tax=Dyella sp. TaxID=1869338 RepID=UPI002D0980E6|nr:lipopolysaccharide biosynthesis protein [Dyella sp.]HTV84491.1 lipopolysaccharide biosynthesis protein [Dyella sp.]